MARAATFHFHDAIGGDPLELDAEDAAALFENAAADLCAEGITGICAAFNAAVHEAVEARAGAPGVLWDLADDSYTYLEGFEPFQWLAPDKNWEPYWFRRRDYCGNILPPAVLRANYEHRLTALAFMAAICRAGDA